MLPNESVGKPLLRKKFPDGEKIDRRKQAWKAISCLFRHLTIPQKSESCCRFSRPNKRLMEGSQGFDESIIVCVGTDEIPKGSIIRANTDRPPVQAYTNRKNRLGRVDLLKLQTRMPWVSQPSAVCLERLLLDMRRQVGKERAEPLSGSGNHALSP